jgi:SAM-dependent methyltransferase
MGTLRNAFNVFNCIEKKLQKIDLKYFYTELYCPVCDTIQYKFNPLPEFYKENSIKYGFRYLGTGEMTALATYSCANCDASDRERLYAYYLRNKFIGNETFNFYHFAPEAGLRRLINDYFINICYKTFDLISADVDIQADLTDLNMVQDNECDFFICSHVLEHIEDDRKAIGELYRITKPGGTGILMAPISLAITKSIENLPGVKTDEDRWQNYGQNDHVRVYAKADFIERINESGFTLYQFDIKHFGKKTFKRLGLKPTSVLYVLKKES